MANTTISVEDYERVRRLLQSRIVSPADELCDALTVAMVNRANVFLTVKYSPDPVECNPFYADDYDRYVHGRGGPPRHNLVTRREIVDLGNTRSRTVRRLVEYLKIRADGYDTFGQMGLCRRRPTPEEWRRLPTEELISSVQSWTPKQVRVRFDRLHKANLVSAERHHSNGPWLYALPEELSVAASPFCNLPSITDRPSNQTTVGE